MDALFDLSVSPSPGPTPPPWQFDIISALIGASVTLLLSGLAYTYRDVLGRGWSALVARLGRLQHRLQASAEERYREQIAAWARASMTPSTASLEAIFIEPNLLVPPPIPQTLSEHIELDPHALPLHRILEDHPFLLIVGAPGSGRTTLLAYLALVCSAACTDRRLALDTVPDSIRKRIPIYIPLHMMTWEETSEITPETEGKPSGDRQDRSKQTDNGLERLLSGSAIVVGGGLTSPLLKYLRDGQAIILVDGWDELLPAQRQAALTWLIEMITALPGNLWLVSAGTHGYAPLADAGFIPLAIASWTPTQISALALRWSEVYAKPDQPPAVSPPDLIDDLKWAARRGATPLELSLRASAYLTSGKPPSKRAALFDHALEAELQRKQDPEQDAPWLLATCRSALGQLALRLQQEGRVVLHRNEIEAAIEAALPPTDERPARAAALAFRVLTGSGLLRAAGADQYSFAHPLWQAYLAARQWVAADPASLIEHLDDPRWAETLRFYAEVGDMGPLASAWLQKPDDMFYSRMDTLSAWIHAAPEDAAWRNGAMAVLARSFIQASAPARKTLAKSLAASGAAGVAYFFKQALQHADPTLRAAAIIGLGDVASDADLPAFEAPLHDDHPAVREAAIQALVSLGSEAARRRLERLLYEGEDPIKPIAAEALARWPESADSLREAARAEDMMVRRAAVFGLIRLGMRDLLGQIAREDEQWIVRSAAASVLEEEEKKSKEVHIAPVPPVDQLPWLISWAAARGEGVGVGQAAWQTLRWALREGDETTRVAAIQILSRAGHPEDVESLQVALADPNPEIAGQAFEALREIARRNDLRIERATG